MRGRLHSGAMLASWLALTVGPSGCERKRGGESTAPTGSPAQADAGAPIPIRFEWPEVVVADVVYVNTKDDGKGGTKTGAFSYQMRAFRDERNVHVFARDFSVVDPESFEPMYHTALDFELQQAGWFVQPSVSLDEGGEIAALGGTDQARALVDATLGELEDKYQDVFRRSAVGKLFDERVYESTASDFWSYVLTLWVDRDLVPGEAWEITGVEEVEGIGEIPTRVEFWTEGEIECFEQAPGPPCVGLIAHTTVGWSGEAAADFLNRFMADLIGKQLPVRADDLELTKTASYGLVAEPATLLPYRLRIELTTEVKGTMTVSDKSEQLDRKKTETREYYWSYVDPDSILTTRKVDDFDCTRFANNGILLMDASKLNDGAKRKQLFEHCQQASRAEVDCVIAARTKDDLRVCVDERGSPQLPYEPVG